MKIIFIYEHFFPPFDEGVKKYAFMLHQQMLASHDVTLIRDLTYLPQVANKLLTVPRILMASLYLRPNRVVYVPQAALTFFSLIRIWLLKAVLGKRLIVVGVQRRNLPRWQQAIARRFKFYNINVLSMMMAHEVAQLGITARILNIGIDRERYTPGSDAAALRNKYGLPADRSVLLHVGHIRASRNIHWLLKVQQALPDIQVLLVGSTATEQDDTLYTELTGGGVIVLRDFIPDIQEVYQLATWYCFPVLNDDGAMEVPLSVLEGMAVDLPVLTTRFGRLPELFTEDDCYRYVNSSEEIVQLLRSGFGQGCHNRPKTAPFTWAAAADTLLND